MSRWHTAGERFVEPRLQGEREVVLLRQADEQILMLLRGKRRGGLEGEGWVGGRVGPVGGWDGVAVGAPRRRGARGRMGQRGREGGGGEERAGGAPARVRRDLG